MDVGCSPLKPTLATPTLLFFGNQGQADGSEGALDGPVQRPPHFSRWPPAAAAWQASHTHSFRTLTALVARAFTAGTWVHDMSPAVWLDCFHATSTSRFMCGSCLLLPCSRASRASSRSEAPTQASVGASLACERPANLDPHTLSVCCSFCCRLPSVTHSFEPVEIFASGWVTRLNGTEQ